VPLVGADVLGDQGARLRDAGAVDEQAVRRRAGQRDVARVRGDVGRGLEVGGDVRRLQDVQQVLADPRVDVAERAPEDGVEAVVPASAPPPAAGHRVSAAGVRARIQSAEPAKISGASLSRVATW
jgi:hypothetical protein